MPEKTLFQQLCLQVDAEFSALSVQERSRIKLLLTQAAEDAYTRGFSAKKAESYGTWTAKKKNEKKELNPT